MTNKIDYFCFAYFTAVPTWENLTVLNLECDVVSPANIISHKNAGKFRYAASTLLYV